MVRLHSPSIPSKVEGLRFYPVGLNLKDKRILVVGAGAIAGKKIKKLLAFGAAVKVIAPEATGRLLNLSKTKKINLIKKKYSPADLKGASLVIAATSDRKTNAKISRDAGKRGIWVNVVDSLKECEFIQTAVLRKHGITISLSTDGKCPKISREFKQFLERKLDEFNSNRH